MQALHLKIITKKSIILTSKLIAIIDTIYSTLRI